MKGGFTVLHCRKIPGKNIPCSIQVPKIISLAVKANRSYLVFNLYTYVQVRCVSPVKKIHIGVRAKNKEH